MLVPVVRPRHSLVKGNEGLADPAASPDCSCRHPGVAALACLVRADDAPLSSAPDWRQGARDHWHSWARNAPSWAKSAAPRLFGA